jgi:nitrite transporter NirC
MTESTVAAVSQAAEQKIGSLRSHPLGYLLLAAMAGVYVGFGIVLIFAVGAPLLAGGSPLARLVMGTSFGIALSLVVFAGSELFTGNVMVMTIGLLRRRVSGGALAAVWAVSFLGNLAGALLLAWLVVRSGVFGGSPHLEVIERVAATKMSLPFATLLVRGLLCNWLVCLGVWTALRAQSEAAKLILIFWCLFAFIAAGFEHSVANMTLLGIALLAPHGAEVSLGGFVHNLTAATAGNVIGGALFMGGAYWLANEPVRPRLPRIARRARATAAHAAGD